MSARPRNLPPRAAGANFPVVNERRDNRNSMQIGDRILIKKTASKEVFILARIDIPHSMEKAFATRSGGDFSMGITVWKSNYIWSAKSQMWIPRN